MKTSNLLSICLWFDNEAEHAAEFYSKIFSDFKLKSISRYGKGFEFHQKP